MAAPRCENCRWWGDGEKAPAFPTLKKCARPDLVKLDEGPRSVVAIAEDIGLAEVWTGPRFGCVAFEPVPPKGLAAAEGTDLVELPTTKPKAVAKGAELPDLVKLQAELVVTWPAAAAEDLAALMGLFWVGQ